MTMIKTTCRLCLVRCGMAVELEDDLSAEISPERGNTPLGKVKKFIGDREHPLSKGYLCIKGKASLDYVSAPDRVIYPQKRVGERGSGQWERVSWNDALDDIASRMNNIIDKYGARAVAVQALPPKEYYAYDLFLEAINSPTFFKHDAHNCFTPQLMSDILTYGSLATYINFMDVEECDTFILWGVNLTETNGSKAVRVGDAVRNNGAKTIVVDPRPTRSAQKADLWLRIRPGTDAALALGMINLMIENNWYDQDFVDSWTIGFDELKARAAEFTPEKTAEITWIPVDKIIEATRMFATAKRSALYTFIGATMGGNSISTLRLMGFLPALTGRIDQAGNNCILQPVKMRLPSYYKPGANDADAARLKDQISADRFPLLSGPNAISAPYPNPSHVIDAMITGEPYPVKALWTNCNPMVGLEDSYRVLEALKSLDLLIVSDMFESPTAHLADYILPVTTHMESDAITEYAGLNLITARVKCMEPRGEVREEADAVLEVMRRMGLSDKMPVQTYHELLDYRLAPLGITFDEFAELGSVIGPDERVKYKNGKMRPDGKPGFNTPSGKIEFTSLKLEEFGYDPLPSFKEPLYSPREADGSQTKVSADYPLVLISGTRAVEYYSTLGISLPRLNKRRPYPGLEMAPETAEKYGLEEGDWAEIEAPTTDKTIIRQVAFLPGMDPRVINAEGLWYMPGEELIEGTLMVGANVLTPLRDDLDPVMGGSTARCLLCRIKKSDYQVVLQAAE
ncbi:MAG: molybdopterin-dependent oxidoreductase [Fimbriimonadaceae bacterium]|nr:molybdopterin-dependent oxidoreductase [Alphaproteobacteria bacterium]